MNNLNYLDSPIRQSPIAVVFIAIKFFRRLGVFNAGAVAFALVSGLSTQRLLFSLTGASILFLISLTTLLLSWWRFTFWVEGDQLQVRKGILSEQKLTIPLDRIQNISIDQKLLHRPLGLVSVNVETAGSEEVELEISATTLPIAESLRQTVGSSEHRPANTVTSGDHIQDSLLVEDETVITSRSIFDLIKIGLGSLPWAGLVIIGPFADEILSRFGIDEDVEGIFSKVFELSFYKIVLIIFALFIGATTLGFTFQILRSLTTNWKLKLTYGPNGLHRTAGLLNKTSKSSRPVRVQSIVTHQNLLQKTLGILKISLPIIGKGDIFLPGSNKSELAELRKIISGWENAPSFDRRISKSYIFLKVRNTSVIVLLITCVIFYFYRQPLIFLSLLLIAYEMFETYRYWNKFRWSLEPNRIASYSEVFSKATLEMDLVKAQSVTVRQSFFQRRRSLANVQILGAEHRLEIPMVPLSEANQVRDFALYHVESSNRPWM